MIHWIKLLGEDHNLITFQRVGDEVHIYVVTSDGRSIDTKDFGALEFRIDIKEFNKVKELLQ